MLKRMTVICTSAVLGVTTGVFAGEIDCCDLDGIGCSDPACGDAVCAVDPFCCEASWDSICAETANEICPICAGPTGACCLPDGTCVDNVSEDQCTNFFSYCSTTASNCCAPTGGPGCNDAECEAAVCAKDAFCCDTEWDSICAGEADQFCAATGGTWFKGLTCNDNPCGKTVTGACCFEDGSCLDLNEDECGAAGGAYQGDGTSCLDADCPQPPACPESDHNCFTPGIPGCTDLACCELVCALDSFCCETDWDTICVGMAEENCNGCGDPDAGDCCDPNGTGTPFCSDRTCCDLVCAVDPFCCEFEWDGLCADQAAKFPECGCVPPPICPDSDHNCFTPGIAGCTDLACCESVCAQDAFCCEFEWDGKCVALAAEFCGGCGDPGAGDCCDENGTGSPYCDNRTCCDLVCAVDPFCCDAEWDSICAGEAAKFPECDCVIPPKGTLSLEAISCQGDAFPNEPGVQIVVELWMRDLTLNATGFQAFVNFNPEMVTYNGSLSSYTAEPFPLHITPIGAAQTSENQLTLDGSDDFNGEGTSADSQLASLVFDVKDECAITMLGFGTSGNFISELSIDGDPIPTNLSGTGPLGLDATPPMIFCPDPIKVAADVEIKTVLPPSSDCCFDNGTPGCSDAECQDIVCAADSFCCSTSWDGICADAAADLCGSLCDGENAFIVDPCVGAVVEFEVVAKDNCGVTSLVCDPPSGSLFEIGETIVTCTATDACGNTATCSFVITVNATNVIKVEVVLVGSLPADRCIHFVASDCGVVVDQVLSFEDPVGVTLGENPVAIAEIEVPCGVYEFLCAKDEQHTKWDTQNLVPDGACYVLEAPLVLRPGDDDNDGDVDINDVTWLIATFGDFAVDGGCPWNGDRDADFNNGGAVQSEDYSLLSAEFLTKSVCACTFGPAASESFDVRLALPTASLSPFQQLADLDRDGLVDWRDVDAFERANGLPAELSRKMRELE